MAKGEITLPGKKTWSNIVWDKAWELEDSYWKTVNFISSGNDILEGIMTNSR